MTATCGTSHATEAGESSGDATQGLTHASSTWFKRPSRLLSLFSGGLAPRRRAPEQCALRDRPGSPALMSHIAGCRASWGKASIITGSRHATPPSQPAAHACMDQACKQVHAICSQRSDFFEALRGTFLILLARYRCQILPADLAGFLYGSLPVWTSPQHLRPSSAAQYLHVPRYLAS